MKRKIYPFLLMAMLLLEILPAAAQVQLVENFNYTSGSTLVSNGWTQIGTTATPAVQVNSGGLTYTGYAQSAIGNAAYVGPAGQDVYLDMSSTISTGNAYASFMMRVDTARTGDYSVALLPNNSTTNYTGRLFIKTSSKDYFKVAVTKGNETAVYSKDSFLLGTVYLVVVKYQFSAKAVTDDTLSVFVLSGSVPSVEPAPTAQGSSTTVQDATNIGRVALRQGSATAGASVAIDGIRAAGNWSDAIGLTGGSVSPPIPVSGITFNTTIPNRLTVNWAKPASYVDSTMSVLVFLKPLNSITVGTFTQPETAFSADSNFSSASSTLHPSDSLAKCVYKGDGSSVTVTGVAVSTLYYVSILVTRRTDTTYSGPVSASATTASNKPSGITAFSFSNQTLHSVRLTWNKPGSYIDSNMTTLIFLKAGSSPTSTGTLDASPSTYTPDTNFSGAGSRFALDSNAKCVFNGDGNLVNIAGLNSGTTYYAVAYVVRSTDSNYYSTGSFAVGSTVSQPGVVTVLNVNGISQTAVTVSWTKPTGYNQTTMNTVVFLKKGNAIQTTGTLNLNAGKYTADTVFNGTGTLFPLDTLAHCVMNSDNNTVTVSGLEVNTDYYALVYVIRTTDSVYSNAAIASGSTFGLTPPPASVSKPTLSSTNNSITLNWTQDTSYNTGTMSTLVFIRKDVSVNQGSPSRSDSYYTAQSDFSIGGTRYENDTNARCVLNSDGNTVTVTGLTPASTYYALIYVVRSGDTSYSVATTSSISTRSDAVSNVIVIGQSSTSAKFTWTKPTGYLNASYSTLVFVKADNPVKEGTATRNISIYSASVNHGNGTRYQNDSMAFCVFKQDTNFVTVQNLIQGKTYHALIFVVKDSDSTYSASATGSGVSLPPAGVTQIGAVNTTNMSTGNPDSLNVRVTLRGLVYGFNQTINGLRFLLRDATGGITASSTTKNFGYTVTEGDSVEVQGTITTNRGLVTVTLDTLFPKGSAHTLKNPTPAVKLSELTENDLVRVNKVKFLTTQSGNWNATTYYTVVDATTDTIAIRVVTTSPLVGTPLPATPTFDVIGMGVQISSSTIAPFAFNGYQIMPRGASDVIERALPDSLDGFSLLNPADHGSLSIGGSISTNFSFNWNAAKVLIAPATAKYTIEIDTFGGNFSVPKLSAFSQNSGADTAISVNVVTLANAFGLHSPGMTATAIWRVKASSSPTYSRLSNTVFTVTLNRGSFNGLENQTGQVGFDLYPNPASHELNIHSLSEMQAVTIYDATGKLVYRSGQQGTRLTVETADWNRGIYLIQVKTGTGAAVRKLILN